MKTEDFVSASLAHWIQSNYHSVQDIARDSLPIMNTESFFRYLSQIPHFPASEFSIVLAGFGEDESSLNQKAKKVGLNLQAIADDFYAAAAWRNDKKNHKRIVAFAHAQQPGVHTLNHFTRPSSRDLAKNVLEWAHDSKDCKSFVKTGAHKKLLKTLQFSKKLHDLRSLETVCNFLAQWSELSIEYKNDAPRLALPELGLLADPDLLSNLDTIEERLVKNFDQTKKIVEVRKSELTARRKRINNLKNIDAKTELLDILARIENLRLNSSRETRKDLTLKEIEKIYKPSDDKKDPEPHPVKKLDSIKINQYSAEALLDDHQDDLVKAIEHLSRSWNENLNENAECIDGEVSFDNQSWEYSIQTDEGFLDWLHKYCTEDIWGGVIHTKEPSLELAIKNHNNTLCEPHFFSIDSIFVLNGRKISLNEAFERFDNDLLSSEPITPDWVRFTELRKEIIKDLDFIVEFPLLWVSAKPNLSTKIDEYIQISGKIYSFVHNNYQAMQEISSDYANIILGGLLTLDFFLVHTHSDSMESHKAIMLPTHPLHLWRFLRLSSILRGFGDDIKPQDRKAILDNVMKPEYFLSVICLEVLPDSNSLQKTHLTLPIANEIHGLATFENLSNALSGSDGIIEFKNTVDRFVILGQHHTYPLRVAVVNPPDPGKIMMEMVDILNTRRSILKKMRVEIFCTKLHKQRSDLSLRLIDEREELEEKISSGRLEYKVNQKPFNNLQEILTSIKNTPFHIIAIFDESSITIQKNTHEKPLPMSPFTVRYDIKYDHYGAGKITLIPKSCESPFSEYMVLIDEALNVQRNLSLSASSDASIMVKRIDEMLDPEKPLAHWVFFADRALPNYANMKSVRLLERFEGRRKVLLTSSDYHQFTHKIMEVFNNSNLSMNESKIEILLSEGIGLIGGGFFNIFKKDGLVDSKQALGLAGMLLAARDYRRRHPESLLVAVDDHITRLWLRIGTESSDRCDLIAIRIENGSFIIESIEVKTRSSDEVDEMSFDHAQEQIIATLDACKAAIPDNLKGDDQLSAPRCEMLKRIFINALQSQTLPPDHRKFWVEQLKNIFDNEMDSTTLEYGGEIISVLIGRNSPPDDGGVTKDSPYPIMVRNLIESQIQDLIDGGSPAIVSPDQSSFQSKKSTDKRENQKQKIETFSQKERNFGEKNKEIENKYKRVTIIEVKTEPKSNVKNINTPKQKEITKSEPVDSKVDKRGTEWPLKLNKFGMIGQYQQVDELVKQVSYSKASGNRFPDKLLVGPAGVGKSSLARKIAGQLLEEEEILFNGADLKNPTMIIDILQENKKVPKDPHGKIKVQKCLIFIDEVHGIGRNVQTALLSAMDDARVTTVDGVTYDFNSVIFILATTDPGKLSEAFNSRPDKTYLRPYTLNEIAGIVWLHGKESNYDLSQEVCLEIAARTRCNPRRAVRTLQNGLIPHIFSIADPGSKKIDYKKLSKAFTRDVVASWFEDQKIDINGLEPLERNFLLYIKKNGTSPQQRLQHGLGISNVQDFNETNEYLVRLGLITVSSGGRTLTKDGRSYLEKPFDLRDRISRQAE